MGAQFIHVNCKNKLNLQEIEETYRNIQQHDKLRNGGHDGYSGDFQTLKHVELHEEVFEDLQSAILYCSQNSTKWGNAIATYYLKNNTVYTLFAGMAAI